MNKKIMMLGLTLLLFFSASPVFAAGTTFNCVGEELPLRWAQITSTLYIIIQIATPLVLIVLGMVDLTKAVTGQKEDEIKKGQKKFIKRIIIAVVILLAFTLVKTAFGIFGINKDTSDSRWKCVECFLDSTKCD